jgi:cytochrome c peroxidase
VGTGFFMKFPTFPDSPYVAEYDLASDTGRATVTKSEADAHMWRVPGLRNLVYTAPYFHNGKVHTIEEAVRVMASTQLGKTLTDAQAADIAAFLESLTGPFPTQQMPRLPPTPGDLID